MNTAQWLWHYEHLEQDQDQDTKKWRSMILILAIMIDPKRGQWLAEQFEALEHSGDASIEHDLMMLRYAQERIEKQKETGMTAPEDFQEKLRRLKEEQAEREGIGDLDVIETADDLLEGDEDGRQSE